MNQTVMLARADVAGIMLGAVFLFMGLAACGLAAVTRSRAKMLLWFGIFTAMYGLRMLAQVPASFGVLPRSGWGSRPYIIAVITYLIILPALLFWYELSLGALRRFLRYTVIVAALTGACGVVTVFVTQSPFTFLPINNLIAVCFALVLAVANLPNLAKKCLVIASPVSTVGTAILVVAILHANLKGFLHLPEYPFLEPLAFGIFLFSLGWVAAEKIFADEKRLLSVESELAVAREIQKSILPSAVPQMKDLKVGAAYLPMTDVAGDFYEFILIDEKRVGFLVADVSGHGVPAALIAGMIKVAMQSVVEQAGKPGEVMRGLNRILTRQLRGQFVSAAYLWMDTENRKALYSAAGHPPLLRWKADKLERIESNGLLFGVFAECEYPVQEIAFDAGDRFMLYTDGVSEPENGQGDAFGDSRLDYVVRGSRSAPAGVVEQVLTEIKKWQQAWVSQQDDITLIVIDAA